LFSTALFLCVPVADAGYKWALEIITSFLITHFGDNIFLKLTSGIRQAEYTFIKEVASVL
jgi:hypothetical protein